MLVTRPCCTSISNDRHDDDCPRIKEEQRKRLHDAAPDILDALKKLVAHCEGMNQAGFLRANGNESKGLAVMALSIGLDRARAAIQKAEEIKGEPDRQGEVRADLN